MVAKILDQGVCLVQVLGPLDVRGIFGLGSRHIITNNLSLGFCTTFPGGHGRLHLFSHTSSSPIGKKVSSKQQVEARS
jgi:hypothetical protein